MCSETVLKCQRALVTCWLLSANIQVLHSQSFTPESARKPEITVTPANAHTRTHERIYAYARTHAVVRSAEELRQADARDKQLVEGHRRARAAHCTDNCPWSVSFM